MKTEPTTMIFVEDPLDARLRMVRVPLSFPRHATPWTVARRASDWAFRAKGSDKYRSHRNSLLALMLARETAP